MSMHLALLCYLFESSSSRSVCNANPCLSIVSRRLLRKISMMAEVGSLDDLGLDCLLDDLDGSAVENDNPSHLEATDVDFNPDMALADPIDARQSLLMHVDETAEDGLKRHLEKFSDGIEQVKKATASFHQAKAEVTSNR